MIVFVILHYLSVEMTTQCIDCIFKSFKEEEIRAVIVDNASPNGSGVALRNKYIDNEYCDVIISKKNLGFANGNNLGYQYAKDNYNPNFIIILNNDVLIMDSLFLSKIKKIYNETPFSILGPDIVSGKTLAHQNPVFSSLKDKETIKLKIKKQEKRLKFFTYYYYRDFLIKKFNLGSILKKTNKKAKPELYKNPQMDNPILHGACYIFSDKFIKVEKYAFNPDTFLYHEEEILHAYCLKKNHLMIYNPNIFVVHLDDISTDIAFKKRYKKKKMILKNSLASLRVFYNLKDN
jgi:GT2 family glycosyltransferase